MSYISWYVLGGMSLSFLTILAWQWGRKHKNTEKNPAFWVKPHSCLILWQHGVFSFTKVCIFLPMLFIRTFLTTLCFYDFCKTVLVKKCTPCQGVVWVSLSKCHIFYTGFSVVLSLHNWSPLKPQNKLQKKSRALPLSYRHVLRAPDPVNPSSEKMTSGSQPTCFCCAYFSKSVMNLHVHWLFNMSCINTHFHMFFKS